MHIGNTQNAKYLFHDRCSNIINTVVIKENNFIRTSFYQKKPQIENKEYVGIWYSNKL